MIGLNSETSKYINGTSHSEFGPSMIEYDSDTAKIKILDKEICVRLNLFSMRPYKEQEKGIDAWL